MPDYAVENFGPPGRQMRAVTWGLRRLFLGPKTIIKTNLYRKQNLFTENEEGVL